MWIRNGDPGSLTLLAGEPSHRVSRKHWIRCCNLDGSLAASHPFLSLTHRIVSET